MTTNTEKLPEWRKALNKAVENYQSVQSWYEENQDSLSAEQDVDAAAGEIEKLIKQCGVLIVVNLLDEIGELQERRKADSAVPAPVVPDEKPMPEASKMHAIDAVAAIAEARGWNACRAAILQGQSEPAPKPSGMSGILPDYEGVAMTQRECYMTGKKAGLDEAGNSPVTPDGLAWVPKRLTAENGAKGVLSGEFSETKFINCPECFGDDECETCDGSGRIEITVPVSWTNIKAIWAKGIEHFTSVPHKENI